MATAAITASASGDTAVVAAVTDKRIRVTGFVLTNGAASVQNVKFRSATTDLTGLLYATAIGLVARDRTDRPDGLFQTVAGEALNVNLSAATAVGGYLTYTLE